MQITTILAFITAMGGFGSCEMVSEVYHLP